MPRKQESAFSLLELSIVLVIIGLLSAGILVGQSLIRAAELRSVTSDQQRYKTAINTFRDKYSALPGDMRNATAFWGKDNALCSTQTGTVAVPGTCNGNNNGIWDLDMVENYRAWQHLSNAGVIEGSYSGYVTPALATTSPTIGTDVPASKMANKYWILAQFSQLNSVHGELGFSGVADERNNYLYFSDKLADIGTALVP